MGIKSMDLGDVRQGFESHLCFSFVLLLMP